MTTSRTTAEVAIWFLLLCGWGLGDDKPVIKSASTEGRLVAVGQVQSLAGGEFEFFNLPGYDGKVTWRVRDSNLAGTKSPLKVFPVAKGQIVIGRLLGSDDIDAHESPDGQSVAVFAVGNGLAEVEALGVDANGFPFTVASLLIQANTGPRPPPEPVKPDEPDEPEPKPEPQGDAGVLQAFAERIASGRLVDSDEAYLTLYGLVEQGDLTKPAADKVDAVLTLKTKPRQLKPADADAVKGVK